MGRSSAHIPGECDQILNLLRQAAWKGDPAPSCDAISARLGINASTVRLRLRDLQTVLVVKTTKRGMVVSCPSEGWRTADLNTDKPRDIPQPLIPITVILRQNVLEALLRTRPSGSAGEVIANLVNETVGA